LESVACPLAVAWVSQSPTPSQICGGSEPVRLRPLGIYRARGPQSLAELVAERGPKARAATPAEAAKAGDIVVVTVPLKSYREVPVAPLAGKVVIDTNSYYPERDGHIAALDSESTTTSELLQSAPPNIEGGEGLQPYLRRGADYRWPAARHEQSSRAGHRRRRCRGKGHHRKID